jgi:hypothetical protein
MPIPSHSPDFITRIFDEEWRLWSFSLCDLFQSPVTSPRLGTNVSLTSLVINKVMNQTCERNGPSQNYVDLFIF